MALNPGFLNAIGSISRNLQQQRPVTYHNTTNNALAQGFLEGNKANMGAIGGVGASHHGPSVISRILDVLSRPEYAVANAAYESEDASANHKGFLKELEGLGTGVIHGLSGTQKRTFADVIQQGKDINAHRGTDMWGNKVNSPTATGTSAGYQLGEGGPLSTGDKWTAFGLNVISDPLNKLGPIKGARALGAKTGLYEIPTAGQVIKNLSQKALSKTAQVGEKEVGLPLGAPEPNTTKLLNINLPALIKAKSIPEVLKAKIGEPMPLGNIEHPYVHLDPEALSNGRLKINDLTDEGKFAADLLHETKLTKFNAEAPAAIQAKKLANIAAGRKIPGWKITQDYIKTAPQKIHSAVEVGNKAREDIVNTIRPTLEHNQRWIADAVRNGIDPARARRVVQEVNAGANFDEALNDAVKHSQVFKGAKIGKSGELKGLTDPAFKLSAVLAPTAKEVLKGVHPENPNAASNIAQVLQAKQLAGMKRAGALTKPLNDQDRVILDEVVQKAVDAIHGNNGYKPIGALNDIVQANLWDNIRHRVAPLTRGGAAAVEAINTRTFHIAAHAEAKLESLGFRPIAGDGTPTRLTDAVASNSGYPNKLGALTTSIINSFANGTLPGAVAKAGEAVAEAKAAKPIIQKAALQVNQIFEDPNLSDPVKFLMSQRTAKGVENAITMATGSTRAAKMGKTIYNAIVNSQASVTDAAVRNAGRALTEIVKTGKYTGDYDSIVRDLGQALSKTFELPPPRVLGTLIGPEAAAEVGVLGRIATWYGQHDLRPSVVRGLSTARANAAMWSKHWHDTFDGLTPEQAVEAWRAAQGLFEAVNPQVVEAAARIRSRMETLLSSSDIQEAARKGNTVAMRAALTHDGKYGLNAELAKAGLNQKFTNKIVKDLFDEPRDYSQGTDWLNSWETFKFAGHPAKSLARLETAIFNASAKKAIFDDIRDKFGTSIADAERNHALKDFPLLDGTYFHPEIANQITRVIRDLYGAAPATSPLLRTMDNIIRMWKTGVTIYAPSHAIRNGMGDIYNNWIAGVNNPRVYSKAIKVMAASRGDYQSLERLGLMVSQRNAIANIEALGEVPGSTVIATTRDGQKLTAAQIKMAAHNQGILLAVEHMEDIGDVNGALGNISRIRPFGGRVSNVAHGFVQGMDHFTRLAHFIHGIEQGSGNLKDILDAAGREVRKYHPDGMDLTGFERSVLRRVIPFYSWTRKAIPFSIEGMFAKPGKFMAYPMLTTALNGGNASNISPGQQFPSDQMFPSWITDMGIGPVGGPGGFLDKLTGGLGGYVTASPGIPPIDLLQGYANHPNQGILGGLTPFAKVPLELMEGHSLDTQIPITSKSEYIGSQLPIVSLLQRLTNVGLGGTTAKGQSQGVGNAQNLVNFLTGLKLTNTGQYIKEAKYEAHQKQVTQKKKNRQHLADFLKGLQQ